MCSLFFNLPKERRRTQPHGLLCYLSCLFVYPVPSLGDCSRVVWNAELKLIAGIPWVRGDLLNETKNLWSVLFNVLHASGLERWGEEWTDILGKVKGLRCRLRLGQEGVDLLAAILTQAAGAVHGIRTFAEICTELSFFELLLCPFVKVGKQLWGNLLAKDLRDQRQVAADTVFHPLQ